MAAPCRAGEANMAVFGEARKRERRELSHDAECRTDPPTRDVTGASLERPLLSNDNWHIFHDAGKTQQACSTTTVFM